MRTSKLTLTPLTLVLIFNHAPAQDGKKKLEQDFESYKANRESDYQNFKKQREEELKKMAADYQDYYNSMVGLKKYYTEQKDTAKANAVDDIIVFEKHVSAALGNPVIVTEQITVNPKDEVADTHPKQIEKNEKPAQPVLPADAKPEAVKAETTFKPLPNENDGVPVLTPIPKIKAKITSPYGMRFHPTLYRMVKHNGIDFGTGKNVEVYTSASGKVILAEYNRGFGNYIIIEHNDGTSSVYAHLSKILILKGNRVNKGDMIGYTGCTGRCTGAHLHYEVRISGIPVNPAGYLKETK